MLQADAGPQDQTRPRRPRDAAVRRKAVPRALGSEGQMRETLTTRARPAVRENKERAKMAVPEGFATESEKCRGISDLIARVSREAETLVPSHLSNGLSHLDSHWTTEGCARHEGSSVSGLRTRRPETRHHWSAPATARVLA